MHLDSGLIHRGSYSYAERLGRGRKETLAVTEVSRFGIIGIESNERRINPEGKHSASSTDDGGLGDTTGIERMRQKRRVAESRVISVIADLTRA